MQDYVSFAEKNGISLYNKGNCQLCGAKTTRGIHECLEIFNLGFQSIDFSLPENHIYRFFIVDAHTLQHPEIHGRWSNHFHLTRLHLIFKYQVAWTYQLSPKLSDTLNKYKAVNKDEKFKASKPLNRGNITTTDILETASDMEKTKLMIWDWAKEVYMNWEGYHGIVDVIAQRFLAVSENSK